jgi:hypothetical protein
MARTKRSCGVSLEERYRSDFERLCAQLLQNDPETCRTSVPHFLPFNSVSDPVDASHRIAEALAGNTIVSHLDLQLGSRIVTASLETYDFLLHAEPMLELLRETQSITSVRLDDVGQDPLLYASLVRCVLSAIAVSVCIESLDLWIPAPLDAFCTFMQTTRIKSLALYLDTLQGESAETVAVAFAAAQSLKSLTLRVDYVSDLCQVVLRSLESHPCMNELVLELKSEYSFVSGGEEFVMEVLLALNHFLRENGRIQTLRISTVSIKLACLELFLQGVLDSVSLKKLTLNFDLDEDARCCLVRFAQSIPETGSHSIQHLCLQRQHRAFESTVVGSLLGAMLTSPPPTIEGSMRPSVGSLIQELSIGDEWDDLESFFEFLATNTSKLCLVRLGTLHQVSWMRHLPELLYLRELHVDHIEQEWIVDPTERSLEFLKSFRRNGSLQLFSMGSATYTRPD